MSTVTVTRYAPCCGGTGGDRPVSSPDDVDSILDDLLPKSERSDSVALEGKFQMLSSLGSYLGVYQELKNPNKAELVEALYEQGVRDASENWVYDFLRIEGEDTTGLIRSKDGEWLEQEFTEFPEGKFTKTYGELTKLAGFFDLYDQYGLSKPSSDELRHAFACFGIEEDPDEPNTYLATLTGEDGTEYPIGVHLDEVTVAYPVDSAGNRIGDNEYTRELLPKLLSKFEAGDIGGTESVEPFAPPLPEQVEDLLDNEQVAENYQLMMHRLAEQAAGESVSDAARERKLSEARFITEVLSGERTWE